MKNIFQLITAVLGLSICILSAQIPAVTWTNYFPFHYYVPYSEYQTETQPPKTTDSFEERTPVASDLTDGRFLIDKIAKLAIFALRRQLTELRAEIALLATKSELDAIQTQLDEKASKTDVDSIQTQLNEKATKLDLENTNLDVANINSNLKILTQDFESATAVVNIGHMPESCADLKTIGYKMNGIFQIKGTKQIEYVYCDFTTNAQDLQKLIGYSDVKSTPIHFFVQITSDYSTVGSPIPFDSAVINEGNAIDLTSGIFKAPRPGVYFFSFTGLVGVSEGTAISNVGLVVGLFLNGDITGMSAVAAVRDANLKQIYPLTLQSTLHLKANDEVMLLILDLSESAMIGSPFNSFTGFMLEEEIVASL